MEPVIAADGEGGAVVAWTDGRSDAGDIYALRIQGTATPVPTVVGPFELRSPRVGLAVWPNPMSGRAWFRLRLQSPGCVTLRIHDIGGRALRDLAFRAVDAGEHVVSWDGRDRHGRKLPPGVYTARARFETGSAGQQDLRARLVVVE
jgi:hypothetical protein